MFSEELFNVFEDDSEKNKKIKRPSKGEETPTNPKKKKLDLDSLEGEKDEEVEKDDSAS